MIYDLMPNKKTRLNLFMSDCLSVSAGFQSIVDLSVRWALGVMISALSLSVICGCAEIDPYDPGIEDTASDSVTIGPDSDSAGTDSDSETTASTTDPCADPDLACPDRPEPRCDEDGDLLQSEIALCEFDGVEVSCTYKEVKVPCLAGCENKACKDVGKCFYDENSDGKNDVVHQPGTDPAVCWRRCPLPAVWNGFACSENGANYLWSKGKQGCEELGYELPGVGLYTGPNVGGGILSGCAAVDLDWTCHPCALSPDCSGMFGNDTGTYWTSTYRFYWLMDCYYKVDLSTGNLNFVDTSHQNQVRCILSNSQ